MLKLIKEYMILPIGTIPTIDDVDYAITIAKQNDCLVYMKWCFYNGWYSVYIEPDDIAQVVWENQIPHTYGV